MTASRTLAHQRPSKSKGKVLIVDDEAAVRDLLRIHLQNAGYEIVAAEDALLAGRLFMEAADTIDLMIVDAKLPYLSGVEFVCALIADTTMPHVPVVLITGHEDIAMQAEILDVPCLVKPF